MNNAAPWGLFEREEVAGEGQAVLLNGAPRSELASLVTKPGQSPARNGALDAQRAEHEERQIAARREGRVRVEDIAALLSF